MERLPLMLVGCGLMGARHLRGQAELERACPGHLELVAVVDAVADHAARVAAEAAELFGRRPAVYTDLTQAIAQSGAVAADLVTPNRTHDAVAVQLLQAGIHVHLEKPFAVTVARGRRILAAQPPGVVLAVAENNRRDPGNRLCQAIVASGLLGAVTFAQQLSFSGGAQVVGTPWRHRLAQGGLPLDVWLHHAYLLELLAGPLAAVQAVGALVQRERLWKPPEGSSQTVVCEGLDTCTAALQFASGATGAWVHHFATAGYGRFERLLVGTAGTLQAPADRGGRSPVVLRPEGNLEGAALLAALPDYQLNPVETALWGARPAGYQYESAVTDRKLIAAELADFIAAIRDGCPPEVPGELGLRSVAVIYALLESVAAGRAVTVDDVLAGRVDAVQRQVEAAGG
ncbi:MAG: Gfo/Idh/MocA family oxidoreductase [Fimbriimonadaceae bacterium]|nr:Gfo/Idh/MocA family oxidoreductase [Fimbriimonadaceae bacterium]